MASLFVMYCFFISPMAHSAEVKASYQERPGWTPLMMLAVDDCYTWKNKGKSVVDWSGESCGIEGLIKVINKTPENIPLFYAAYHEYGTDEVKAFDLKHATQFDYLNFSHELSKRLSSSSVVLGIYNDYVLDRKAMGLGEVSRDTFKKKAAEIASKQNDLHKQITELSVQNAPNKHVASQDEKLGISYKATCGPYSIDLSASDGWARINGAKPESQKIVNMKDSGDVKIEWRMATSQPGLWVGMEYIKRDGKAILNTQMLRASMDAPREFATYDCVKVK